jgi:ABC-type multidrug transport system ATPase subunit
MTVNGVDPHKPCGCCGPKRQSCRRLLAIIGPSGAGKTTLLAALAGQVPVSQRMRLSGSVTVNGVPIDRAGHRQGYVQQEDIFYSQLTVRWPAG